MILEESTEWYISLAKSGDKKLQNHPESPWMFEGMSSPWAKQFCHHGIMVFPCASDTAFVLKAQERYLMSFKGVCWLATLPSRRPTHKLSFITQAQMWSNHIQSRIWWIHHLSAGLHFRQWIFVVDMLCIWLCWIRDKNVDSATSDAFFRQEYLFAMTPLHEMRCLAETP